MSESYMTDIMTGERLNPAPPESMSAVDSNYVPWQVEPNLCVECGEPIPSTMMAWGISGVGVFHSGCYYRWEGNRMIAKFKCDKITHYVGAIPVTDEHGKPVRGRGPNTIDQTVGPVIAFEMSPVYHGGDPDHENARYWAASPSGKFTLEVANLAACGILEPGAEYYIEIRRAP